MNIETIQALNAAFEQFRNDNDTRWTTIKSQLEALETAFARGEFQGGGSSRSGSKPEAAEHSHRFMNWIRTGKGENELRDFEVRAELSTVSDPDGGYLVPDEMEQSIERLAIASVAMRRLARNVKATGQYQKPTSQGGASGGWVGEREEREDTDTPELALFQPPMCEMYALPKVTQVLLDSTFFAVDAWLLDEVSDTLTELEGTAFISGSGVKQPKGLFAYDTIANANWTWGKIGYVAGGHASLFNNVDKLFDLQHAVKPVYRQNGTWLMNDTTLSVIRKFKDGDGNYVWRPGLSENAPDTLLGKPIEIDDNVDDIGAGKFPVAFGDFKKAYTIVDNPRGTRLIRDNLTTKGYVKFYVTRRTTGGCSNFQSVKFLKISES